MHAAGLGLVLLATIAGLYVRPFGARDWHVALVGGAAAWLAGPLGYRGGLRTLENAWSIEAFFLGLMLLAAGAEASGLYARLAAALARLPHGRGRLAGVLFAGTAITTVFSNDATPLVLTPAVFAVGLGEGELAAAAFGVTFMADGASLILPVSNPVNLLFYERFHMGFGLYTRELLPAAVAGALVLAAVFALRTRPGNAGDARPAPAYDELTRDGPMSLVALGLVPVLAAAYVVAAIAEFPLGLVTLAGGVALLLVGALSGHIETSYYRKHVAPGLLVFVAGLLVLTQSVSDAGTLDWLAGILQGLAGQPSLVAVLGAAAIAAVLSNLVNNWPAALLLAVALDGISGGRSPLIAGTLIGCTIGANFTVVGSLSTVFWLTLCRAQGTRFFPGEYARRAALPTLLGVVAACLVASALA